MDELTSKSGVIKATSILQRCIAVIRKAPKPTMNRAPREQKNSVKRIQESPPLSMCLPTREAITTRISQSTELYWVEIVSATEFFRVERTEVLRRRSVDL